MMNKNKMQTNHSPTSFSSRVQAAYHANRDMRTKRQQQPCKPKTLKGMTTTGCDFRHPCCMQIYLNQPLPLTPQEHKDHINNLLAAWKDLKYHSSPSRNELVQALQLIEQAVAYADKNKLVFYEAKAQLYRGQVLLRLGCPAEASWCATRAYGWIEKKTGVEGRGQREATKLKNEAEAALDALNPGDPRRYLGDDFRTIPGRMSGVGSPKHNRQPAQQGGGRKQIERRQISKWSATTAATTATKSHSTELSFRVGIRLVDQDSATSVPYSGPPTIGIVHEENGELWKGAGSRSSVMLGNKDETRTLHVVNSPPSPRWQIGEEIDLQISALSQAHHSAPTWSKRRELTPPYSSLSRRE